MESQPTTTTVEIIIKKLNQQFLFEIKYPPKATGSKGPERNSISEKSRAVISDKGDVHCSRFYFFP